MKRSEFILQYNLTIGIKQLILRTTNW